MESPWEILKASYSTLSQLYRNVFIDSCSSASLELGAEGAIVTYFVTRSIFKRRDKAFKYSSLVFFIMPAIYWPFCRVREKRYLTESGITVVDTQEELGQISSIESTQEMLQEPDLKIDTV